MRGVASAAIALAAFVVGVIILGGGVLIGALPVDTYGPAVAASGIYLGLWIVLWEYMP